MHQFINDQFLYVQVHYYCSNYTNIMSIGCS